MLSIFFVSLIFFKQNNIKGTPNYRHNFKIFLIPPFNIT